MIFLEKKSYNPTSTMLSSTKHTPIFVKARGSVVEAPLCNQEVMSSNPGMWKAILKIVSPGFELLTR